MQGHHVDPGTRRLRFLTHWAGNIHVDNRGSAKQKLDRKGCGNEIRKAGVTPCTSSLVTHTPPCERASHSQSSSPGSGLDHCRVLGATQRILCTSTPVLFVPIALPGVKHTAFSTHQADHCTHPPLHHRDSAQLPTCTSAVLCAPAPRAPNASPA